MWKRIGIGMVLGSVTGLAAGQLQYRTSLLGLPQPLYSTPKGMAGSAIGGAVFGGVSGGAVASTTVGAAFAGALSGFGGGLLGGGIIGTIAS